MENLRAGQAGSAGTESTELDRLYANTQRSYVDLAMGVVRAAYNIVFVNTYFPTQDIHSFTNIDVTINDMERIANTIKLLQGGDVTAEDIARIASTLQLLKGTDSRFRRLFVKVTEDLVKRLNLGAEAIGQRADVALPGTPTLLGDRLEDAKKVAVYAGNIVKLSNYAKFFIADELRKNNGGNFDVANLSKEAVQMLQAFPNGNDQMRHFMHNFHKVEDVFRRTDTADMFKAGTEINLHDEVTLAMAVRVAGRSQAGGR